MDLPVKVYIFDDGHGESAMELFSGESSSGRNLDVEKIKYQCENKYDPDYETVIKAFSLAYHEENYEDLYIIICKSSAVSVASSQRIIDVIEEVVFNECFDIFYLSKWLDRCDQYSNIKELDSGMKLVNTISPNGIHCIMFSPRGRNKFLTWYYPSENPIVNRTLGQVLNARIGEEYENGAFVALSTTPTLINFDVVSNKDDPVNVLKTIECRNIPFLAKPEAKCTTTAMQFFYLIIIIIIIVLIAFILIRYFTKHETICIGDFCPSPPEIPSIEGDGHQRPFITRY